MHCPLATALTIEREDPVGKARPPGQRVGWQQASAHAVGIAEAA
jgi:hypothetical protein